MSYPLVQFTSDTLTTTKAAASSGHLLLRLHLMALLLTCMADVLIFGSLDMIIELLHQHKVLHKCLELARDALSPGLGGGTGLESELKVQMLTCLLRVFRVTLEKHANPKVSPIAIGAHSLVLGVNKITIE